MVRHEKNIHAYDLVDVPPKHIIKEITLSVCSENKKGPVIADQPF
jgi:hypothetical protein